ncbi:SusC/RagA family TonB-linked outer membrane protein [Dinghuibacter silviterrae]|nr:SusC/RagA family TonB-linked outer membrane protein [Dinghuibacter silviterrae]
MKLTTLLLTVALVEAHGGGMAQNVNLSGQHLSLKTVFSKITRQTGYAFFYSYSLLKQAHPVDLDARDMPLLKVLDLCFAGQPLGYAIENKTVVITARQVAPVNTTGAAPPITIRGKVIDEKGNPVVSASVKVKGSNIGTSTDADGVFSLKVPEGTVLIISSAEYGSTEVTVRKDETISIQLKAANKEVSEVVVTGFGETRQKRSLGYSVTQVSGDDIRATMQANPISALQGMVTGLQVQPGVAGQASTPRILLRGASSLNAYENNPLVVVDGVILDDQSVTQTQGASTDFGNILKDINPDDVESISVLKGGAVTALYGSRAANGVLLIKTKKGKAQKGLGVSFSQEVTFQRAYKTTDFQNTYGAGLYADDWSTGPNGVLAINQSDYGISFGPAMTGQTFQDINGYIRKNNPNSHDLLDLYQTGHVYNTNVSLSGGNENSTIRMSYSRLGSNTVLPNNKFDRNSFFVRATHRIGSWVNLDATATYVHSYNLNPAQQGGNSPMYQFSYDGARNYDAKYWSTHYADSVVGGINNADISGISYYIFYPLYENNYFQTEDNLRAGLDLTATITPWLSFAGNASMNLYNVNHQSEIRGQQPHFGNPNYSGSISDLLQARYRGEFILAHKFGELTPSLHVGGDLFTSGQTGNSWSMNGGGVLPDIYRLSNSAKPANITENAPNKSQLTAVYFQAAVGWRYLTLNLYGRNDWNSSLVYNNGHGVYSYFYGGSDLAFVFSDLLDQKPSFLSYGKLRLSYAQAGNGTDPYTANTGAYTSIGAYSGGTTAVSQYQYQSSTLGNQTLVPEKSAKLEGGLELSFLHDRLGADFAVYRQDTRNQIIAFGVPSTSGVSAALVNGGLVRNKGIELTINAVPVQSKNFVWTTRFNYTLNRNSVVSLPFGARYETLEGEDGIQSVAIAGGAYGAMVARYGYAKYVAPDPKSSLNGMPVLAMGYGGTQAYYKRAGDYGTTPETKEPVIGNIQPKFLGSLFNTFTYKNFSLNIFLDARFGGTEYSTTYFYGSQDGNIKSTLFGRSAALGGLTFTPGNATSQYLGFPLGTAPRHDGIALNGVFQSGSTSLGSDGATHDVSGMTFDQAYKLGYVLPVNATDYYVKTYSWSAGIRQAGVFTNSWVSLRQVAVGYDLPASLIHKLRFNNLRLSLAGRNLLYLYNSAPDHINPENTNDSGAGSAFEEGGVPYVRNFSFLINANF